MSVSYSGPVFDGSAEPMIERMIEEVRSTVADQAMVEWESNMESRIRHSGPVYQTFAHVKEDGDETLVNDGWGETNELPYGPWLEGVGSRNSPVTVFPGYHSLGDAYEATLEQVDELVEPVVEDWVGKIND
jgi:hypothetical protein